MNTPPLHQADIDMLRTLQSLRDFVLAGNFTDGAEYCGALERAMHRIKGGGRRKRFAHGQHKALVAATPPGGTLPARDHSHAACLCAVARSMKRKAVMRRVAPGKPERTVTLID